MFSQQQYPAPLPPQELSIVPLPPPHQEVPQFMHEEVTEEEKQFVIQFTEWESQFKAWKEENKNHPDKVQSMIIFSVNMMLTGAYF